MNCQYPGCHKRDALYYICWEEWEIFPNHPSNMTARKSCGYVCAHHDKVIGRTNLIKCGFSLEEAIEWESANKIIPNNSSQVARWNKNLTSVKGGDKVSV